MDDQGILKAAIALARATFPHPNPRVGAVVVAPDGTEIARGAHQGPGTPHAEAAAVAAAGPAAAGATVVVTLEPCDHEGRTPPCTAQLIAAGVARVVVGAGDPDTRVDGRGFARLRAAGIEVAGPIDPAAVEAADPAYFHHRRTGRPLITLKVATTLDGQAAAADGTSQWITSPEARAHGHGLRAESDAVLVGGGTLITDDPRLDVRLPGFAGRQPRPVVVAGARRLPAGARIWERDPLVYSPAPIPDRDAVVMPGPGGVDLGAMVSDLAGRGMLGLLIEGGPVLAGGMWRAGVVDRVALYLGAAVAAGTGRPAFDGVWETLGDARRGTVRGVTRLGPDVLIEFDVEEA